MQQEVGAQAVSYTTGVPAMIGSALMLNGLARTRRLEHGQFDPDPFMAMLNEHGALACAGMRQPFASE